MPLQINKVPIHEHAFWWQGKKGVITVLLNKFETNNDASYLKEEEEAEEDVVNVEDEEHALLTLDVYQAPISYF